MKRIKAFAVALVSSILVQLAAIPVSYAYESCMVANPASAGTTAGWTALVYTSCKAEATLDDEVKYSGTSSLKITNPTPYGANLYMQAYTSTKKLEKGKTYRYGAMVKAKDASAVDIYVLQGAVRSVSSSLTPLTNTYDWQKIEITYTSAADSAADIRFQCEDATEGFWIDDVFCYEYQDGKYIGNNLVSNSGFDGAAPSTDVGAPDVPEMSASEQIKILEEKYQAIRESTEFDADEIKAVMGNFKFIPMSYKNDLIIDGDVSDWSGITQIGLPTNSEQYRIYKEGTVPDVIGNFKMAYDEKNLYLAVEVTDDVHYTIDNDNCWEADSLQIALGTEQDGYGVEINMTRNMETGKGGVYSGSLDKFDLETIVMVPSIDGNTVTYEMAIPWKIRWSEVPESIMFDILINDNDKSGRAYVVELAPGIAEGKTNLEFPKAVPVDKDSGWYTWLEGSKKVKAGEDNTYDLYLVNEGEEASFTITPPNGGEAETVTIGKGKGIHRVYNVVFSGYGKQKCEAHILKGDAEQSTSLQVEVEMGADDYRKWLDNVKGYASEIEALVEECTLVGINPEYEKLNLELLKYFSKEMEKDIDNSFFIWLAYTYDSLNEIYNKARTNLKAYLSGEKEPEIVPIYAGGDREPVGSVYYAEADVNGVKEKRPIFYVGFGHFGYNAELYKSLSADTATIGDQWPWFMMFDSAKQPYVNRNAGAYEPALLPFLENSADKNIKIEYLLGAEKGNNYLTSAYPETALTKGGGTLNFYHPTVRKYIEWEADKMFPEIFSYGSVGSVTVSNEPSFLYTDKEEAYQPYWAAHLAEVYKGDINYLNKTYGTDYKDFLSVARPAEPEASAWYYDWQAFNNKLFADYVGFYTDLVHKYDPDMPVHVKMRPLASSQDSAKHIFLDYGAGIEELAKVTTVNGCDAHAYYNAASWASQEKSMQYDMLRGIRNAPVYNTEDHIIVDGNTYMGYEQADHVEGDLWQGAIHGRAVSDIWYWSKSYNASSLDYGMWPFRPDCVEAVGRTHYDLNRLGYEVAAFANKKPRSAVLYSVGSRVFDKPHMCALYEAYTDLLNNGETVKYIADTTSSDVFECETLFVPYVKHTTTEVVDNIYSFIQKGGKVVLLGSDCLKYDVHNYPQDEAKLDYIYKNSQIVEFNEDGSYVISQNSKDLIEKTVINTLEAIGTQLVLTDASTGERIKDVEYTSVEYDGKTLVNVISYGDWGADKEVKILYNGAEISKSLDLRTNTSYGKVVTLERSIPLLLELNAGEGEQVLPFDDIKGHWGKENITALYDKGMVHGVGNRMFMPDSDVTVAEFLTMIENAVGLEKKAYTLELSDVSSDAWYASAVQTAYEAGMLNTLIKDNKLSPDRAITREEMCAVAVSAYEYAAEKELSTGTAVFDDNADIGTEFQMYINKAYANKFIYGAGNNKFIPKDSASRAEAVTIILNILNVKNS